MIVEMSVLLGFVIAIEAVVGLLALGFTFVLYRRQPSMPYLLVMVGISTILLRASAGVLQLAGVLHFATSDLLDHGLDIVMILAFVGAIYTMDDIDEDRWTTSAEDDDPEVDTQ